MLIVVLSKIFLRHVVLPWGKNHCRWVELMLPRPSSLCLLPRVVQIFIPSSAVRVIAAHHALRASDRLILRHIILAHLRIYLLDLVVPSVKLLLCFKRVGSWLEIDSAHVLMRFKNWQILWVVGRSTATFDKLGIFILTAALIDLLDLWLKILYYLLLLRLRLARKIHDVNLVWHHLGLECIVQVPLNRCFLTTRILLLSTILHSQCHLASSTRIFIKSERG